MNPPAHPGAAVVHRSGKGFRCLADLTVLSDQNQLRQTLAYMISAYQYFRKTVKCTAVVKVYDPTFYVFVKNIEKNHNYTYGDVAFIPWKGDESYVLKLFGFLDPVDEETVKQASQTE